MASDIPEPVTSTGTPSSVGIDDLAIHVPRLYLDMRDFAALRAADYDKLNKGLGLSAMAIPDVHEDTATMGAMAVMRLIDRNGLNPRHRSSVLGDGIRTRWRQTDGHVHRGDADTTLRIPVR